ncbi:hypothetical protein [Chromobacterium sphagni]|uniref:hypothetical protein n=1 Tax=Chromobacterium sphagni TaxID=1903179 RepID=UPI001113ECC8|nr:hypothetical protein [Chromobacterium sphagni]
MKFYAFGIDDFNTSGEINFNLMRGRTRMGLAVERVSCAYRRLAARRNSGWRAFSRRGAHLWRGGWGGRAGILIVQENV